MPIRDASESVLYSPLEPARAVVERKRLQTYVETRLSGDTVGVQRVLDMLGFFDKKIFEQGD